MKGVPVECVNQIYQQYIRYCDRECQQKDWKPHRPVCKKLARLSGSMILGAKWGAVKNFRSHFLIYFNVR